MNAELDELSGFYRQQLSSKDSEIKRLRDYISRLESSEGGIRQEFSRQLSEKDKEIQKALKSINSKVPASKDKVADLYLSQLKEKDNELGMLRSRISEFEASGNLVAEEASRQLSEKDSQIRRMMKLLRAKDAENSRLSGQLDQQVKIEKDYVEKIKSAIEKRGKSTTDAMRGMMEELERKSSEVERLRNVILAQEKVNKQLDNQSIQDRSQLNHLAAFLEEKDLIRQKLEHNFTQQLREKDRELDHFGKELKAQLSRHDSSKLTEEVAGLRAKLNVKETETAELAREYTELKGQNSVLAKRLQERQKLFVESENTYNKIVSTLQAQHDKRVREILHKNSEKESQLRSELEKMRTEVAEKDAIVNEKSGRIDETLLQFAETARKLIDLKGPEYTTASLSISHLKEKEEALNKREAELGKLLEQATQRIRDALQKEAEVEKREVMLLKEQEALSSELDVLKNAGMEIGKEKEYLKQKISQYSEHPALPRQQLEVEAPQNEEGIEEMALPEIGQAAPKPKAKSVFKTSDEKSDVLSILRRPKNTEIDADGILPQEGKDTPDARKNIFNQARLNSKVLPKPTTTSMQEKIDRPKLKEELIKKASKADAFPETSGYGELDEIKSIISIGLQHNDKPEQIRASLEGSGYSKKNIEKAFQESQLIK